jgi:hypothetical protein
MKKRLERAFLAILVGLFIFQLASFRGQLSSQEYPAKRQISDYLSSFLSRSTQPLGLKEDQKLRQLLYQAPVKWVIRASPRHILN